MGAGDRIEFGGSISVMGASFSTPGTLAISTSLGTILFGGVSLAPGAPDEFVAGTDGATGNGYIAVACFVEGTLIKTDAGERAVETLRAGNRVWAVLHESYEPIIWIGHRRIDCARHPTPRAVWPVRISSGAFGAGSPARDLDLSPDHAVHLAGALIPIKHLINGTTIVQMRRQSVRYYHVELPKHDVLLAEAMPVESYLDVGDRASFGDGSGPIVLHPDFASLRHEAGGCAPLVVSGPELVRARALVAMRAKALEQNREALAAANDFLDRHGLWSDGKRLFWLQRNDHPRDQCALAGVRANRLIFR
jgi:Hint domain